MKLTNARLCLDCDEVHEEDNQCPMCASESFAFIKRWVTTPEKKVRAAAAITPPSEAVVTYKALLQANDSEPTTIKRLLRGGALGLAVLGAAGWILHRKTEKNTEEKDTVEKDTDKNPEENAEKNVKTEPDTTPESPS
jgi:hypothetical protein